jgi:DNA-binding LacI/PurR family transcriptional regulator
VRADRVSRHCATARADLSVIGFDDIPAGRTSHPPLTTVAQPLRERGVLAGRLMCALLRDEPTRAPEPFTTSLVVRRSTAPPP